MHAYVHACMYALSVQSFACQLSLVISALSLVILALSLNEYLIAKASIGEGGVGDYCPGVRVTYKRSAYYFVMISNTAVTYCNREYTGPKNYSV